MHLISNNPTEIRLTHFVFLLLVISDGSLAAVGRLAGEFDVDSRGNAVHTIPIEVPDGRGSLVPTIALSYSSAGADDLAGMGWTLSGFSKIERCATHRPIDDDRRGVQFDAHDRYCLDGQSLIAISPGRCGTDIVEFRTEIDNLARITCHGNMTSGPEYFQVQQPNGRTLFFGDTGNSRFAAREKAPGTFLAWALSTIKDRFGNAVSFHYEEMLESGISTGEYVPARVSWTNYCRFSSPCADRSGNYQLEFQYEPRPVDDARHGYIWGARIARTQRLRSIRFISAGSLIHEYRLSYLAAEDSGSNRRSLLASVEKCDSDGPSADCLGLTRFGWRVGEAGWISGITGPTVPNAHHARYGDWDGDGSIDLYVPSNGFWTIHRSAMGDYSSDLRGSQVAAPPGSFSRAITLEFNGDGRADLLAPDGQDQWRVYLANDWSVLSPNISIQLPDATTASVSAQDIDGDGLDDLLYVAQVNNAYKLFVRFSTGFVFTPPVESLNLTGPNPYYIYNTPRSIPADFDGDGREDLLLALPEQTGAGWEESYASKYFVYLARGETFSSQPIWESGDFISTIGPIDFNGDRLSDLLLQRICFQPPCQLNYELVASRGNVLVSQAITDIVWEGPFVATDYDSDGRQDVITPQGGRYRVFTSDGDNYRNAADRVHDVTVDGQAIDPDDILAFNNADVSSSGLASLVLIQSTGSTSSGRIRTLDHMGPRGPLLTKIIDGLGNTYDISYSTTGELANESPRKYWSSETTFTISPEFSAHIYHRLLHGSNRSVVDGYSRNDGVGGAYSISLTYWNERLHTLGRGLLGFARIRRTDSRADEPVLQTDYRQTFPYSGLLASRAHLRPSTLTPLRRLSYVYQNAAAASPSSAESGSARFVYATTRSQSDHKLLDGSIFREATTEWSYFNPNTGREDFSHGAPFREIEVTLVPSGPQWMTESTFEYEDSARDQSHCLALPGRVDETRTSPDGVSQTRTRQVRHFSATCEKFIERAGPANNPATQLVRRYQYDPFGNVSRLHEHAGDVSWTSGRETIYSYGTGKWSGYRLSQKRRTVIPGVDEHGNQTANPAFALSESYEYRHEFGVLASETSPQGRTARYAYDGFGRLRSELVDGIQASRGIDYQSCGVECSFAGPHAVYQVLNTKTEAPAYLARVVFDAYGREIGREESLLGGKVSRNLTEYDARGNVVREAMPHFSSDAPVFRVSTHDLLDRTTSVSMPVTTSGGAETAITTMSYDGLVISVTDALGRTSVSTYNPTGTLQRLVSNAGSTHRYSLEYGYSPFDQLAELRDIDDGTVLSAFEYDERGYMISRSDIESGLRTFNYDAFGQLIETVDAEGNSVETDYDVIGRPTSRRDKNPKGATANFATWEYKPAGTMGVGLLARSTTGEGFAETMQYDALGRPLRVIKTILGTEFTTDYTYDDLDRLESITYPVAGPAGRATFRYRYDPATGLAQGIEQPAAGWEPVYTVLEADVLGRAALARFGGTNGYEERHLFESRGLRPSAIQTGNAAALQNLAYSWDKVGNLVGRSMLAGPIPIVESFTYDAADRLTSAALSGDVTLSVTYAGDGSIASKSGVGDYSYEPNRPRTLANINGPRTAFFAHNTNGELVCRGPVHPCDIATGGTLIYWNEANLPASILDASGNSAHFRYGPERERFREVETSPAGGVTRTIVGPHFHVEQHYGGATRYHANVYFNDRLVLIQVSDGSGDLEAYYVHQDHLGSIDKLSFAYGSQTDDLSMSFDAFGKRRFAHDWTVDTTDSLLSQMQWTRVGFAAHDHLDNLKLIHMGGRVYDPIIGRMLSPDPVIGDIHRIQSLNRYAYVSNNPLRFTDPTGLEQDSTPGWSPLADNIIIYSPRPRPAESLSGLLRVSTDLFAKNSRASFDAAVRFEASRSVPVASGAVGGLTLPTAVQRRIQDAEEAKRRIRGQGKMIPGPGLARDLRRRNSLLSLSIEQEAEQNSLEIDSTTSLSSAAAVPGEEVISEFLSGAGSYFRGVYRAFRQEARRLGYLGPGDAASVAREEIILGAALEFALQHPDFVAEVTRSAISKNPGRALGRGTAALGVNFIVGPYIGTSGSVLAIYGDSAYVIELGYTDVGIIIENVLTAPN